MDWTATLEDTNPRPSAEFVAEQIALGEDLPPIQRLSNILPDPDYKLLLQELWETVLLRTERGLQHGQIKEKDRLYNHLYNGKGAFGYKGFCIPGEKFTPMIEKLRTILEQILHAKFNSCMVNVH